MVAFGTTSNEILYDFGNITVGDTIGGFAYQGAPFVHSQDSVLVDGEYRKRYDVSIPEHIYKDYWVGVIGSLKELSKAL